MNTQVNTESLAFPLCSDASGLDPKYLPVGLPSSPPPWPAELARALHRPSAAWRRHKGGTAESTDSTQEGVLERDGWKMKDEKGR